MGTLLQIASGIAALAVAGAFAFLFYVKINALDIHNPWKYASRHAPAAVQEVPITYIPAGAKVRYKELWRARMEGTADYLRVPLYRLEEMYQRGLADRLSNWRWVNVPSSEWPVAWQ